MSDREVLRQALYQWERRFTDYGSGISSRDLAVLKQDYWMAHGVEPLKELIREVTLEVVSERKEEARGLQKMRSRSR